MTKDKILVYSTVHRTFYIQVASKYLPNYYPTPPPNNYYQYKQSISAWS